MLIRVDPTNGRAIYAQIADSVRGEIAAGRLRPGETLPSARQVATGLDVNQHTVLHAYQLLRDEGFIDLRRGRGAVVTAKAGGIAELYRNAQQLAAQAAGLGVESSALAAIVAHATRSRETDGARAVETGSATPGRGADPAFAEDPPRDPARTRVPKEAIA